MTTAPAGSFTTGSAFGFTVSAEDANGNVDTNYSGNVTVALPANNPGGAGTVLSGTRTVQAMNGVATFSGLSLNNAGNNYSLNITSSPTLTATTSGLFSVTQSAASQIVISSQPRSVVLPGGSGFGFTALIEDASGNVVTTFSGPVTAVLVANPGNDTLLGTTTVNAVNGVATFTNLILNNQATGYTLEAVSGGLTSPPTNAFNVAINPPTHLVFTSPPAGNLPAGTPFGGTVTVEDANNQPVTSYNGPVTISLGSGPAGSAISTGVGSATVVSGGAGYLSNPTVTIGGPGGSGTQAQATATETGGVVNGITITTPGSGYSGQVSVTVSPPTARATATAGAPVAGSLPLGALTIVSGGAGYTAPPVVQLVGGGGTGATATASITGGVVTSITISPGNAGTGYISAPTVRIAPPTATAHAAEVVGSNGAVSGVTLVGPVDAIAVTNGGSGYSAASPPLVTIAAPSNGTTATAAAVVNSSGVITSITINSGGSGYLLATPPVVTIAAPGGTGTQATAVASVAQGGAGYLSTPAVSLTELVAPATGTAAVGPGNSGALNANLTLTSGGDGYTSPPTVTFVGGNPTTPAQGLATINAAGQVTGITDSGVASFTLSGVASIAVSSGGQSYTAGTPVIITSADGLGSGAAATAVVTGDVITSVTITNAGSGYDMAPVITFGGAGTGAIATATIDSGGSGYTPGSSPAVTIAAPTGTNPITALAKATVDSHGVVTSIVVTNPGNGYTTVPGVTIAAPSSGVRATATALITSRGAGYQSAPMVVISAPEIPAGATVPLAGTAPSPIGATITVTNPGAGYTSAPAVIFSGGDPTTPATATASINAAGQVIGITEISPARGYTSAPTITIAPPTPQQTTATAVLANGVVTRHQLHGIAAITPGCRRHGLLERESARGHDRRLPPAPTRCKRRPRRL